MPLFEQTYISYGSLQLAFEVRNILTHFMGFDYLSILKFLIVLHKSPHPALSFIFLMNKFNLVLFSQTISIKNVFIENLLYLHTNSQ